MKLLDTTVAIDHLRGHAPAVALLRKLIEDGETVFASEVVRFELLAGVRVNELEALERFFSAIGWVAVDEGVTRAAGSLARKHRRTHGGIDDVDYIIAATALLLDAQLLTTNVRHFPLLRDIEAPF
ncbi:MAG: type II toxin-antitoxin system VapC family toxin [Actinomycetota bacterium]